mmetsp:Transcript_119937/g.373530  ORF Transcript_119937/g.373530 Transcript_119937/m.373530 type:complete len:95 (-) Transcript_119937:70-354(-)
MDHLSQHPWLSLPWGHPVGRSLREAFQVTHLPRLVIVDMNGRVLSKNARGGLTGFGFCCDPLRVYAELLRRLKSPQNFGAPSDSDDTSEDSDPE